MRHFGRGVNYDKIDACFNGSDGGKLLGLPADAWNKAYPTKASVPCTEVDGVETKIPASYDTTKSAMCASGSKAAVCVQDRLEEETCLV